MEPKKRGFSAFLEGKKRGFYAFLRDFAAKNATARGFCAVLEPKKTGLNPVFASSFYLAPLF